MFIDAFLSADIVTQFFTVALVLWIGNHSAQPHPQMKRLGSQIACAAFLADAVWLIARNNMQLTSELDVIAMHAGAVTVLTLGVSWTLLPVIATVFGTVVRAPMRRGVRVLGRGWKAWLHHRSHREQRLAKSEQERLQPERERQAAELEAERTRLLEEQQTRDQLRFDVKLFYDRYRTELQSVFPQDTFDAYFSSFLTDSTPLDLFEQRAEQLRDMIRDRLQLGGQEQHRFETVEDLLQYFTEQKRRLTELAADDPDALETLVSVLAEAQDRALEEFLL